MITQTLAISYIADLIILFGGIAVAVLGAVLTAMFLYDVVLNSMSKTYSHFGAGASGDSVPSVSKKSSKRTKESMMAKRKAGTMTDKDWAWVDKNMF